MTLVASRRARLLALATALAVVGCRRTVQLDGPGDGGGGDSRGSGGSGSGGGGGGGHRDDGGRPDVQQFCAGGQIKFLRISPHTPDVIIALDRTAAMQARFGFNNGTRFSTAQENLSRLINSYDAAVRFAYLEFPAPNDACTAAAGCCAGGITPLVPQIQSFNVINPLMSGACDSCTATQRPIAEALAAARQAYGRASGRAQFVLLVTAADPTCTANPSAASPCAAAQTEVIMLRNEQVKTAVVVVGDDAAPNGCLDALAMGGGKPRNNAPPSYYPAANGSDLDRVIENLGRDIAQEACAIDLLDTPGPGDDVVLFIDFTEVPRSDTNGWSFDGPQNLRIVLRGDACDRFVAVPDRFQLVSCPSTFRN